MAYIITIVAVVLAGIFALLVDVWASFVYFVLAILLLLALFWGDWLIYKYFTAYQKEVEDGFALFKAQIINSKNISTEEFDASLEYYKKEYAKSLKKEKFMKWLAICFCFAVAAAFVLGMIYY